MHKVIKRRTGLAQLDLAELWAYRELLGFLAWRDVAVRYKQTTVGILWAFIRPLVTMVVFTVIFGRIAGLPSAGIPYPVLTFAALLPWQFFATAFTDASFSIVGNAHVISKIYFPRLIIPLASVVVAAVDFLVSFFFLILIMIGYRMLPSPRILWLPAFAVLCVIFTLGVSLWFAALYVRYRDVRHFIPFLVTIGLYLSPVGFNSSLIPERWRFLYSLNPMVGVIDGFRWSLLGMDTLYAPGLAASVALSLAFFLTGLYYFKQTERTFADVI
jgi:lipopolysaccharide transport system permease protein